MGLEPADLLLARLKEQGVAQPSAEAPGLRRTLAAVEALGRDPSYAASAIDAAQHEPPFAGELVCRVIASDVPRSASDDLGTIGAYRLLAKLGEGGMGAVYKALHTHLEKVVAIKVLPTDRMDPAAIARLQREMRAVGKLKHPNIVRAMDAGEQQGRHFLVMEHVQGRSPAG